MVIGIIEVHKNLYKTVFEELSFLIFIFFIGPLYVLNLTFSSLVFIFEGVRSIHLEISFIYTNENNASNEVETVVDNQGGEISLLLNLGI